MPVKKPVKKTVSTIEKVYTTVTKMPNGTIKTVYPKSVNANGVSSQYTKFEVPFSYKKKK